MTLDDQLARIAQLRLRGARLRLIVYALWVALSQSVMAGCQSSGFMFATFTLMDVFFNPLGDRFSWYANGGRYAGDFGLIFAAFALVMVSGQIAYRIKSSRR